MKPIVHRLEEQYGNNIEFVYVNIDNPESQTLKEQYGFRVQPHFVLVGGDGQVIGEWFGVNEGATFETAFTDVLN